MTHNSVRTGMMVKIIGINITHKRHNSCYEMNKMVGKTFRVAEIRSAHYPGSRKGEIMVVLNSDGGVERYVWTPEDLEYNGPKIKLPEKATFNPDNIVRL